uniref:Uncharacterized protein n=1 Tax=Pisum sativum TaxID=3888 RepID=V9H1B7_PEA|nr:hypothetical protein 91 - garden pea chloroplast [Pisum sativum]CAA25831.1 hypothetical protein [Pisum sativum]
MYTIRLFPWDCSSIGQSTALSRRKLRVRVPSVPMDTNPIKKIKYQWISCMKGNKNKNKISFLTGIPFFLSFLVCLRERFGQRKKKDFLIAS